MNEMLGKIHFWGSFICINIVFLPMFIQGLAGMNRRLYDGGVQYAHAQAVLQLEHRACRHGGVGRWRCSSFRSSSTSSGASSEGKPVGDEPVGCDDARVVGDPSPPRRTATS